MFIVRVVDASLFAFPPTPVIPNLSTYNDRQAHGFAPSISKWTESV
jgi:hypothetical protein